MKWTKMNDKIAFGGGCHWCTEAVFQSLKGVEKVEQGYVASIDENNAFSEAVIVHFEPITIALETQIEIHLHTHKSTRQHSMRYKYRSAVYTFSEEQKHKVKGVIDSIQGTFESEIITKVVPFDSFKASPEMFQNYYQKNPNKPFCKTFINPKLSLLIKQFSIHINSEI